MACAHPLTIKPSVQVGNQFFSYPKPFHVPCGYCLNCRRDKQNYIVDRANYEYCRRLTASFVTLTYDDPHLIRECAILDPAGGFFYDRASDGSKVIRTSLNYKNIRNFIHALRERVKYFYETHPENKISPLMQPDFSYLYCGEYGDCFGRCHFHILFFGLDFAYCKKLFMDTWKFGFIDVLPLLDGGIRYVTKYMDKFEKGLLAEQAYDFKGRARPKLCMSIGFGQGLLWDKVDDIKSHDWTYPISHNLRRPVSAYWKKLCTGHVSAYDPTMKNPFEKTDEYIARHKRKVYNLATSYGLRRRHSDEYLMSDIFQDNFKLRLARIREHNLQIQIRNDGHPTYDNFSDVLKSHFGFVTYDGKKIRRLPSWKKRLLADEYRLALQKKQLDKYFPEQFIEVCYE